MKAIYLTGFMGSGKTTIGARLGELTGFPVYDIDKEVERLAGTSIARIFEEEGEASFRSRETEALELLPAERCIISAGGGTVLSERNRRWMLEKGEMVFLDCGIKEIQKRLTSDTERPLIAKDRMNQIEKLYQERLPVYRMAPIIIDTGGKTIDEICGEILERINE
ncbi:shikimate kinase [Peribacillus kribbensis]|uniref:shikimate kinase n=1 Tax=Peribacillus kribbensis TaxID=356658 RepID=UPI0004027219|nr:shikimate kinase [Peribacillus kribbensis]